MKRNNLLLFLMVGFGVIIIMFFSISAKSKNFSGEDAIKTREELDKILTRARESCGGASITLGVLVGNEIVYANAFGVTNIDNPKPVTTRSLYHMASVSKPFVATAIMQLVEKGKIDLDQKLIYYLPYFKLADEHYKEITIRQMLNHTAGIPDVYNYEWDKPQYDDGAAERYIRSLKNEKMIAVPGKVMRYSNMAFDILADVIARVSGVTFEKYMKDNIFIPLEMNDTTYLKKEVPDKLATFAHVVSGNGYWGKVVVSPVYPYNRAHAPSSTLHSNVIDMMKWGMVNLNKGEYKGKRILQASSYDILWKPTRGGIGLSWVISSYNGLTLIWHSGADTGFRSYFVMVPAKNIAIVSMGNSSTCNPYQVVMSTLEFLLR